MRNECGWPKFDPYGSFGVFKDTLLLGHVVIWHDPVNFSSDARFS